MAAEITQVLATIDAAAGSATSYSASLADASEELQGASNSLHGGGDGVALRAVIERLERDEFRFVHILSLPSSVSTVRV
jgi:hypothetical protein